MHSHAILPEQSPTAVSMPPQLQENSITNPPNQWRSIRAIIFSSLLNVLLVFIPISWAINFALPHQHALIFVFSFLSIIPLVKLLTFATDDLSLRVGQARAVLLNATLGNAAELIVLVIAFRKCQSEIVQSSLVGSVLSKLLVVPSMYFFAGGLRFPDLVFRSSTAQLNSSILTVGVIAVLLPPISHWVLQKLPQFDKLSIHHAALNTSHVIATMLFIIYASYLIFQFFSHSASYIGDGEDIQPIGDYAGEEQFRLHRRRILRSNIMDDEIMSTSWTRNGVAMTPPSIRLEGAIPDVERNALSLASVRSGVPNQAQMSIGVSLPLLAMVFALVAVTTEILVDSIDGLTESGSISKEFIGVILLPMINNVVEGVTVATAPAKDTLRLAVGVTVGATIQLFFLVIPSIVIIGWIMDNGLMLLFDPLELVTMFLSVLTYVVLGGSLKSDWVKGMGLMCLYVIWAAAFWYYPGSFGAGSQCQC